MLYGSIGSSLSNNNAPPLPALSFGPHMNTHRCGRFLFGQCFSCWVSLQTQAESFRFVHRVCENSLVLKICATRRKNEHIVSEWQTLSIDIKWHLHTHIRRVEELIALNHWTSTRSVTVLLGVNHDCLPQSLRRQKSWRTSVLILERVEREQLRLLCHVSVGLRWE